MNQQGIALPILIGVIFALIAITVGGRLVFIKEQPSRFEPRPEVTLKVTSAKDVYKTGEEIRLLLRLTNSGSVETCVSDVIEGNIRFVSLTRDGEDVTTRSTPIYFRVVLPKMLAASLTPLSGGKSLDFSISSWNDMGLGRQALRTVAMADSRSMATFYDVESPGEYKLEAVYEYIGDAHSDCPRIFSGETNHSTTTFTVLP